GEDSGGRHREEQEQVVYYYDVATIWIRPVDLKVEQALVLRLMRLRDIMGAKSAPGASAKNRKNRENLGAYTRTLWSSLGAGGGGVDSG
ncbi:unnamed protein product, partial [Laminaria digitata]